MAADLTLTDRNRKKRAYLLLLLLAVFAALYFDSTDVSPSPS